jgi:hypothetical protein
MAASQGAAQLGLAKQNAVSAAISSATTGNAIVHWSYRPREVSCSSTVAGSIMSQMLLAWDEAHWWDHGARSSQTPARCRQL